MTSNWNLDLAKNIKELIFNANLPILFLIICYIAVLKSDLKKIIKYLMALSLFLFMFFCFHFTPQLLMSLLLSPEDKYLETHFSATNPKTLIQIPACAHNTNGIIVLGAGTTYANTPSFSGLTRLLGLIELLNNSKETHLWQKNKTPIIFSGGYTGPTPMKSEAQVLNSYAQFIYGKQFSNFNVITENNSKNTYQNAFYSNEIFTKKQIKKNIILITNTFHMQRAKKVYQAQGFAVCPVSVATKDLEGNGLFNFKNATNTVTLLNEFFGIAGYYMKGWI